eukprot:SAG11_NODE_847_length_6882_cov_3.352204_7_plen_212_part_00
MWTMPTLASLAAAAVLWIALDIAHAQDRHDSACDLEHVHTTLSAIQEICCVNNDDPDGPGHARCANGLHPGANDECSRPCKDLVAPFWERCGAQLQAGGMELAGMDEFVETCEAMPVCDLATMFDHLKTVQEICCAGDNCAGRYLGTDSACHPSCANIFEPFWLDCGSALTMMGFGGRMTYFFDTCLETLYPPGQCGDVCDGGDECMQSHW